MKTVSLLLLFFSIAAFAKIQEEDCKSYSFYQNYSNNFRSQLGTGYCSAFAGTALVSEFFCQQDPSLCGKDLSIMDMVTRCDEVHTDSQEGYYPGQLLKCIGERGICLDDDAPYPQINGFFQAFAAALVGEPDPFAKITQRLSRSRVRVRSVRRRLRSYDIELDPRLESIIREERVSEFSMSELLEIALVPDRCKENRIVHPFKAYQVDNSGTPLEFHQSMNDRFRTTGRGVLLAYRRNKSGHAVVINGQRWNRRKEQCEYLVRNSWIDHPLHRWVSADRYSKLSFYYNYIE